MREVYFDPTEGVKINKGFKIKAHVHPSRRIFDPSSTDLRPIFDGCSTHLPRIFDPCSTVVRSIFDGLFALSWANFIKITLGWVNLIKKALFKIGLKT